MKKLILLTFTCCILEMGFAQITSTNGTYKTGSNTTNLALQTGASTTRVTVLASSGNVGINNTNPTFRLDVNGTVRGGNFNSTSGIYNVASPTASFLLQTNGTPRMTVFNSNGFVGINTTNPGFMLDVNGPINTTGLFVNGQPFSGSSQWTTSGTSIFYNSGNVGIGTTTPAELLHVNGNILSTQVTANNGTFNAGGTSNLSLRTNNAARVTILNTNGFVGIGTPTPTEMLQVNGTSLSTQFTSSSGAYNSTGNLSLQTAGTSRLSILSSNGNVGVGTTSPEAKLHVAGNVVMDNGGNPMIYTGTGAAENGRYLQLTNSTQTATPSGMKAGGILVADDFNYASPPKNNLVVKGRVGIGTPLTANPNDYMLAVNGKIGAKDVQVERNSGTWPDYVFSAAYELPSLAEVELYIQKNNHLPDVPSAKEIEAKGHDLGAMDEILLKKVEELTLYIIEQQKEIEGLKKQIAEQQKK